MRRRRLATSSFLVFTMLVSLAVLGVLHQPRSRTPVVVLDPGHGGDETGAVANGVTERDSNLDIALRVEALLVREGVHVVLTRRSAGRAEGVDGAPDLTGYSATFTDLQERVAIANAARANAFVSIHSNFSSDPTAQGFEVWYDELRTFSEQNRVLAGLLLGEVDRALLSAVSVAVDRGIKSDTDLVDATGRNTPLLVLGPERDLSRDELIDRGGDPAVLGFGPGQQSIRTSSTDMPGALVELLFVSNANDAALLRDETARDALARGIAAALLQFLDQQR